jgi:multiple sugar transport system permease protein
MPDEKTTGTSSHGALPRRVQEGRKASTRPAVEELSILHRKKFGMSFYGWILLPVIILLAAITLYPFFWMIVKSFYHVATKPGQQDEWVGLKNYIGLFKDGLFLNGWWIQLRYVVISLVVEFVLGFALALFLNNLKRTANIITTIILIPMMIAPVAVGFLHMYLFNSSFGWYHWLLKSVGLLSGGSILGDMEWAMAAIIIADVWEWTPFMALIFLAGLKKVPLDQLEAAKCDGAPPVKRFFDVVLPNMTSVIVIAVLIRFMDIMRYIDTIFVMTTGGPAGATKTVSYYLFDVAFRYFEIGRGAAHGFVLLLVTIIIAQVFVTVMNKSKKGMAR